MPTSYIVRHGVTRMLGDFTPANGDGYRRGTKVVIRSERGVETGEVLCEASEAILPQLQLTESSKGQILRTLSANDQNELDKLAEREAKELDAAREIIHKHDLPMELVDVEHLLGGDRIVFYFLAENRVDFRDLVKDLAREFNARIEMRQIGVRDEAKILADYGDCGRPVCCNTHLVQMPPVSMRMAKIQKSTLDPNKLSGRCGRLKCCLRYEMEVYEEFQAQLPPVGAHILTAKGKGKVLAQEILAKRVLVMFEDGRRVAIPAAEVTSRL